MSSNYLQSNRDQHVSETDPFTIKRYEQFAKRIPTGAVRALDVGCGVGRGGAALHRLLPALEIVGVDVVPERIAALDPSVYREGVVGVTMALPFEDESFDVIVAGEFLEHLYPRDVDGTLSEFFRVLRVGGRLLLTTPNPADIKRRARRQTVLGGAHVTQHHVRSLRVRLRSVGFSRVRVRGSGRVSARVGQWPVALSLFGSYMASADKW